MQSKIACILLSAVLFVLSFVCIFFPGDAFSESERRKLAEFPELSSESLFSGSFTERFEEYATDRFPFRDAFRSIKAYSSLFLFNEKDNNGIYTSGGHLAKIEHPLNIPMLDNAAGRFEFLYNSYLKNTSAKLYFSIVPDKHRYLSSPAGVLSLDYEELASYMREKTPYLEYIDLFTHLSADHYYFTDSHWRQEKLPDVAKELLGKMGVDADPSYDESVLSSPFYGVYHGQSALFTQPDKITLLTNKTLSQCKVTSYKTGVAEEIPVYDTEKATSKDPYDIFLGGASPIVKTENPSAREKRELIIFRDSFASSLAPLLVEGYSEITLVDIRYIRSAQLGTFVDFSSADDVLFLYSTGLLNSSLALK